MRVIFLDIDGVLNTWTTRSRGGMDNIDPGRLAMLHQLIADTGARVVLSSTWRLLEPVEKMNRLLGLELLGYTPDLGDQVRGMEIDRWFYDNEPVSSFVIFDDRDDMGPHKGRLVRTTDKDGLTWRHCRRAKELLGL